MKKKQNNKPAVIVPASKILQSITASGKLSPHLIKEAETAYKDYIDNIHLDRDLNNFFSGHISEIYEFIQNANNIPADPIKDLSALEDLISSIAIFRSDAGTFTNKTGLFKIASTILNWIESIDKINADSLKILEIYLDSVRLFASNDNLNEKIIDQLIDELSGACERYFKKYPDIVREEEFKN